jgi:molecular chaperone GrpE (heat shock protein)
MDEIRHEKLELGLSDEALVKLETDAQSGTTQINAAGETNRLLMMKIEEIQQRLDHLHEEFQGKLKYDAHKDRIIDHLHQELQEYKNDIIKKHVQSLIMDLIKVIDDARKFTEHYRTKDSSSADMAKLLDFLDNIPSDLEDILHWQGIKTFIGSGSAFDPCRQRVLKKIETIDQSKDKTVAESLRPGYEWDGKVVRPEMVSVYFYTETAFEPQQLSHSPGLAERLVDESENR